MARPTVMTKGPKSYPKVVHICPLGVPRDSSPVKNNTDKDFRVHWKHFSRGLYLKARLQKFSAPYQLSFLAELLSLFMAATATYDNLDEILFYGIFFVLKFCLE